MGAASPVSPSGLIENAQAEHFRLILETAPEAMVVTKAPKVLIIDEMGYLPLDDLGATIFFQLVSARYERGSIILTSNKELRRLGLDLRGSDHCHGHSGPATASLDDH